MAFYIKERERESKTVCLLGNVITFLLLLENVSDIHKICLFCQVKTYSEDQDTRYERTNKANKWESTKQKRIKNVRQKKEEKEEKNTAQDKNATTYEKSESLKAWIKR